MEFAVAPSVLSQLRCSASRDDQTSVAIEARL